MKSFLETWRDIEGYEGLYQVSDFGDVRSLGRVVGNGKGYFKEMRVLKPVKQTNGYLRVYLWKNGKKKHHRVHRLVAQAFIPNPYNLPEVNHIDEVKTNNVVSNLEWCNRKYNISYGTRNQRHAKALRGVYNNPKKSKKPIQLTLDYVFVKEWESTNECGRNGFDQSHVSACCRNEYCKQGNIYKGCRWMYAEDYYSSIANMLSATDAQSCLYVSKYALGT